MPDSMFRVFSTVVFTLVLSIPGRSQEATPSPHKQPHSNRRASVEYKNAKYGFTFTLPQSWKGFKVLWSEWQGSVLGNNGRVDYVLHGPKLVIRHPKWTQDNPREDMPILIYTIEQWNNSPIVSAAPFDPSELGRNKRYVFAVPPRWDYDFGEGFEEAEKILTPRSLHAFEPKK